MTLLELARKLRPYIEKAAMSLEDADALEAIQLFPHWSGENVGYFVDDKVQYDNILYRCLQAHTSQNTSNKCHKSIFLCAICNLAFLN